MPQTPKFPTNGAAVLSPPAALMLDVATLGQGGSTLLVGTFQPLLVGTFQPIDIAKKNENKLRTYHTWISIEVCTRPTSLTKFNGGQNPPRDAEEPIRGRIRAMINYKKYYMKNVMWVVYGDQHTPGQRE